MEQMLEIFYVLYIYIYIYILFVLLFFICIYIYKTIYYIVVYHTILYYSNKSLTSSSSGKSAHWRERGSCQLALISASVGGMELLMVAASHGALAAAAHGSWQPASNHALPHGIVKALPLNKKHQVKQTEIPKIQNYLASENPNPMIYLSGGTGDNTEEERQRP